MVNAEPRGAARKLLHAQARVALPGGAVLRGKTIDLSLSGVSLLVAEQIPVGQVCPVAIETLLNGKAVRITARAKIVYSILKGTDGYRTGMHFVEIDAANHHTLAELML